MRVSTWSISIIDYIPISPLYIKLHLPSLSSPVMMPPVLLVLVLLVLSSSIGKKCWSVRLSDDDPWCSDCSDHHYDLLCGDCSEEKHPEYCHLRMILCLQLLKLNRKSDKHQDLSFYQVPKPRKRVQHYIDYN